VIGSLPTSFAEGLLAGLGQPFNALEYLFAVIAVGCLAAAPTRGVALVLAYAVAAMIGTSAHIREATIAGTGTLVSLAVIALGFVLFRIKPPRQDIALALLGGTGLVLGYASGATIAAAPPEAIYGYLAGLALILPLLAIAAMQLARLLASRTALQPNAGRLFGAMTMALGAAGLVRQMLAGA
jgi:hydrogenase/urease accessory protein HupE